MIIGSRKATGAFAVASLLQRRRCPLPNSGRQGYVRERSTQRWGASAMTNASVLTSNPQKLCIVCAHPIPEAAKFCIHCENHQGWFRRNIGVGETTLALLVALVAAIGAAIPPIGALFSRPSASIVQTSVVFTDGSLKVVMANAGERAGVFQLARVLFRIDDQSPAVMVNFDIPGNPILLPGDWRVFTLKPGEPLSREVDDKKKFALAMQEHDFRNALEAGRNAVAARPLKCDVVFHSASVSGGETTETAETNCVAAWLSLFPGDRPLFLDAHRRLEADLTAAATP